MPKTTGHVQNLIPVRTGQAIGLANCSTYTTVHGMGRVLPRVV